jgi:hypothetical protein
MGDHHGRPQAPHQRRNDHQRGLPICEPLNRCGVGEGQHRTDLNVDSCKASISNAVRKGPEMSEAARAHRLAPQPVVIAAGTPITCELGHSVGVAATDLRANEPLAVEMFVHWQTAPPRAGDMFPRCGICGAPAHREGEEGLELHTPEGWRSLKDTARTGVATKGDVDDAAARLDAKIDAMARHYEAVLWKHTIGVILNVLVIGWLLIWFFR